MSYIKNIFLRYFGIRNIGGHLNLDKGIFRIFISAPHDPLPDFQGPKHLKYGRGKDHPRYGRWTYAFAKFYKPDIIVEVGTYAGGTAVGWAKALKENEKGRLVCIDNDTYSTGTFPVIARRNIEKTSLEEGRFDLKSGDSKIIVPKVAEDLKGKVDIYLVDGDHSYEGALADIENGLPMIKPGGFLLVHDVDTKRKMDEETKEHPHPVYEAFKKVIEDNGFNWCILKFIRKHLGIIEVR